MLRFNHKVQQLVSEFWNRAGIEPIYPIDSGLLERAIVLTFPLSIVKINKLSFQAVVNWMTQNGLSPTASNPENNVALFGLLFVNKGTGFIFIDGCAQSNEQLFTLAHEVSHFVLDYQQQKKQLTYALGQDASDIFHGLRKPSLDEQIKGLIKGVETGSFVHLIENNVTETWQKMHIWKVENKADLFAMELLAPLKSVAIELKKLKISLNYNDIIQNLPVILETKYCFPAYLANKYAKLVAYAITGGDSFLARLRN